jgi:valyl-tRNA synthetase
MAADQAMPEAAGRDYAPYDPAEVEQALYQRWEERGYFKPRPVPDGKPPFVITMPPPNVTGALHIGHALTATIQDALIRWHRMLGEPTLWVPGRDHAGIAAQLVVERLLAEEGLSRHDLGREKFVERMWAWMDKYGKVIQIQHKRLGASADWEREAFTMDPGPVRAVRTAFVRLYERGLIYRGNRITNWCPRCQTALSDLEVEHEEVQGTLTYFRYPLVSNHPPGTGASRAASGAPVPADYVTVATTRPETILADTGIAVHPADERYRDLVGRKAIVPHVKREIPVVTDEAVDPAFGTGAVKVTPGHDPTDFDIGQRHGLPVLIGMNLDGTMNEHTGAYAGLPTLEARRKLVEELDHEGLLVRQEPHSHALGHCQRCHTVVEPIVSDQWYVKIAPLAQPALEAVRDGRIRIVPERFVKVYFNWLEHIRDWCISRQLWWGHRIPVWYCRACGGETAAVTDPSACARCGDKDLHQDPDVLDTWFSSGLWPFSTLGWPDNTDDLRTYYPTTLMETGYDILFFWVARMIMAGLEFTGDVPFRCVYLHGMIRVEREKMSKLKGNVQDPLELIERYGTDALRLALVTGTTPGNDINLSREHHELIDSRNFVNKLWNAARFVRSQFADAGGERPLAGEEARASTASNWTLADRWINSRTQALITQVDALLSDLQFGEAARAIREFIWLEYCDWYLEIAKVQLRDSSGHGSRQATLSTLVRVLDSALRLLHPFAPFVTEVIWQTIRRPDDAESLMIADWPKSSPRDEAAEDEFGAARELVSVVRRLRSDYRIDWSRRVAAVVEAGDRAPLQEEQAAWIGALGRLEPLEITARLDHEPRRALSAVAGGRRVYLPIEGLFDLGQELARLSHERQDAAAKLERSEQLLARPAFADRAPPHVVQAERDKLVQLRERLKLLEDRLATLRSMSAE